MTEKRYPLFNKTNLRIFNKAGVLVGDHCCSNPEMAPTSQARELYEQTKSPDDYLAQQYGYDENEVSWEGEIMSLRDFMAQRRKEAEIVRERSKETN